LNTAAEVIANAWRNEKPYAGTAG